MILIKPLHSLRALLVTLCLGVCLSPCLSWGNEFDDTDSLDLYNGFEEKQAISSRIPRPTSSIAENVTVITATDIERLNAHTLVEVLQTIPGIQFDKIQTPGNFSFFSILGTLNRHIQVTIDGIPQNFLSSDSMAEMGTIPVQMIERVEVVKGAASAGWGPGLGGTISIFTKAPDTTRPAGGLVSGSIGSKYTADSRVEASGTLKGLGYYLTAGDLRSDGLTPGTQVRFNHGFGKLTYQLPQSGSISLGIDLRDKSSGLEDYVPYDYHDSYDVRYASGYLSFRYPLADQLTLGIKGYVGRRQMDTVWGSLVGPDLFQDSRIQERYRGANADITWGDAETGVTAGLEYDHHDLHQRDHIRQAPEFNFDRRMERLSGHLNGIWTIGRLSLLPGFRFDHNSLFDDAYSYTLGATYKLTDSTTLRGYAARGYSMPIVSGAATLNDNFQNQNAQTVQTGFESTAIPYLWVKGTLFYNNIWKIQSFDLSTSPAIVTREEQVRQGAELELRTAPLYGVTLSSSYTFTESWSKDTKAELPSGQSGPRQSVKFGLNYDNNDIGLRGTLTSNYAWWKTQEDGSADTSSTIWDLHLNWKPFQKKEMSPELFFSVRNIFNGDQYLVNFLPNAPRWFEGGVRVRF